MLQLNYRIPKVTLNLKVSQSAANLYIDFCLPVLATSILLCKIKNDILEVSLDLSVFFFKTSKWRAKADT